MNRVHSVVFETASKYCISDSFVDYDGYSISSKGFLPTVVDIMVIGVKFTHSCITSSFAQLSQGTWNLRPMNQGKLEVLKQEMARVNIDILGISELKCTGMSKFNSDDHYIYYCGQESLRRKGVALIVNKRV